MTSKLLALSLMLLPLGALPAADFMPPFQMPKVTEPKIPHRSVSIVDFGAVPDGKTLNTAAINQAITTLAGKVGGRVNFPPGMWLTGPIALQNNIELHLEAGCLVQFKPEFDLYPPLDIDMKGRKQTVTTSPIHGENLENIAITGHGVFDGAGDFWRPMKKVKSTDSEWKQLLAQTNSVHDDKTGMWWPSAEARAIHRMPLLKLSNCKKILLEGVTFQNSPSWNLNPMLCEDVTIRNISEQNAWNAQNGDGLDMDHCRNVIVRGSRFDAGDDGICLKSGADAEGRRVAVPTENILIEDCVVYRAHGGVTIGSEMSSGVRNVRVNHCLFMGTDEGLRFKSRRGRGGVVEKIYVSNVEMTEIATDAIGFSMFYESSKPPSADSDGAAPAESKSPKADEGTPQFRDIYISDLICRGAAQAVTLQGLPEMPIRGIHLRNISINADRGITCTDAQDISFENVEINNRFGPVVNLVNARDVNFDHLTYPAGPEALFKAQGAGTSGISIKNTDVKSAAQDFIFSDGATRAAFVLP
jgi:DNA sulfur modification protein DndE